VDCGSVAGSEVLTTPGLWALCDRESTPCARESTPCDRESTPCDRESTSVAGSEVLTTPGLWVPLVCVRNVYILPGIPRLFNAMVEASKDRFAGPGMVLETLKTLQGKGVDSPSQGVV
jgi:hypothetical protein